MNLVIVTNGRVLILTEGAKLLHERRSDRVEGCVCSWRWPGGSTTFFETRKWSSSGNASLQDNEGEEQINRFSWKLDWMRMRDEVVTKIDFIGLLNLCWDEEGERRWVVNSEGYGWFIHKRDLHVWGSAYVVDIQNKQVRGNPDSWIPRLSPTPYPCPVLSEDAYKRCKRRSVMHGLYHLDNPPNGIP